MNVEPIKFLKNMKKLLKAMVANKMTEILYKFKWMKIKMSLN